MQTALTDRLIGNPIEHERQKNKAKTQDYLQKELIKQAFVVFKCGHNFHKKCIISQMSIKQ